MNAVKSLSVLLSGALIILMASCGPSYLSTGVGYSQPPYYGGYGYARRPVIVAPPVVVRPRYYAPPPRAYYPGARGRSYGGGWSRGRR
ncbi:hypothetical protein [Fibrella forsythiae]|uniref:Lipoprotein n=1 Tax=Fibrella forsythiae TaxID=2817061 RepID=A0ABS3JCN5_9BACT|nr:hypothetical protein [Fibrella forsythiae]MBO0947757.1 hypothetical protein [Fibrella forsythiae]